MHRQRFSYRLRIITAIYSHTLTTVYTKAQPRNQIKSSFSLRISLKGTSFSPIAYSDKAGRERALRGHTATQRIHNIHLSPRAIPGFYTSMAKTGHINAHTSERTAFEHCRSNRHRHPFSVRSAARNLYGGAKHLPCLFFRRLRMQSLLYNLLVGGIGPAPGQVRSHRMHGYEGGGSGTKTDLSPAFAQPK